MELVNTAIQFELPTRTEPLVLATEEELAVFSQEQSGELSGLSLFDGLSTRIFRSINRFEFVGTVSPSLGSVAVAHYLTVRSHKHDVVMTGTHELSCHCHLAELRVI